MKYFVAIFSLLLLTTQLAFSQTLNARVNLQTSDFILPEDKNLINEVPQNLRDYINNFDWGEEDREMTIRCEINFVIENMVERGGQKVFSGQILVSSQSGENFVDRGVQFPYQSGQLMDHNRSSYDALLTLVDYYIFMIIGGEVDCYIKQGGTQYYDQARTRVSEGRISAFAGGWSNRQEELERILNSDHIGLREAKFYFYEGLFYVEARQDQERARKYAKDVIESLDKVYSRRPNSISLKRFLDAHYTEFCDLFQFDENRQNLLSMARIDNRHRETYLECIISNAGGRLLER